MLTKNKLLEIATYEHIDGFYITKREDNGQEITRRDFKKLELISLKNNNLLNPPKKANAVLFLEVKSEENQSMRLAYYIHLKNVLNDDIRSFCNRKVFGKDDWINEMRLNYGKVYPLKEVSF